jgi:hypothetical protein
MDEFAFPIEHDMLLIFDCFFLKSFKIKMINTTLAANISPVFFFSTTHER